MLTILQANYLAETDWMDITGIHWFLYPVVSWYQLQYSLLPHSPFICLISLPGVCVCPLLVEPSTGIPIKGRTHKHVRKVTTFFFNLFITSFLFTQTAPLCSLSPHPHSPQDKSHVLPSHTRLPGKISSQDMKGEERVEILSLRTLPSRLP